MQDDKSIIAHN